MKIYDFRGAPNPKKLRIYLAEKGIDVPFETVDIQKGETRNSEFLDRNPLGGLPVLELDDGTCVPESLAIIEYFEELHPDPPMIGTTPEERLQVRSLERVCELGVLMRVAAIVQNSHPFFAARIDQSPAVVAQARGFLSRSLDYLDARLGDQPFLVGQRPTIADCTLCAALYFAHVMNAGVDLSDHGNLARWHQAFRQRPSASA